MNRPVWAIVTHALLPNGAAHRLVGALRDDGQRVGFCAIPFPGGVRWRAERVIPGRESNVLVDEARHVSPLRETFSALDIGRFAWQMASSGCRDVVLVGCDPLVFLEAVAAFGSSPVRVRTKVAWFVDWSAQRLAHAVPAAAYRLATRTTLALADVTAAISPAAADAVAGVGRHRHDVAVLANQPLHLGSIPSWSDRRQAVAYVGGLSAHQGVAILLQAGRLLARDGVEVDIVGDGPASGEVARAVAHEPRMHFHGLLAGRDQLASIMLTARVGWALYDPGFPMHGLGDPLKVKDYLAAGMRVVSTLPTGTADEVITAAGYSVSSLVAATRHALAQPPASDPASHPMLLAAPQSLRSFIDTLTAR